MLSEGGHLRIYSGMKKDKRAATGVGCVIHKTSKDYTELGRICVSEGTHS